MAQGDDTKGPSGAAQRARAALMQQMSSMRGSPGPQGMTGQPGPVGPPGGTGPKGEAGAPGELVRGYMGRLASWEISDGLVGRCEELRWAG